MKIIYYLNTCNTCKRILKELNPNKSIELREIKSSPLQAVEIESLKDKTGTYEAIFNRRSQLYKAYGLKDKALTEEDYKKYLEEHYTFLKRPIIVVDKKIFVGNAKKNVELAKIALDSLS